MPRTPLALPLAVALALAACAPRGAQPRDAASAAGAAPTAAASSSGAAPSSAVVDAATARSLAAAGARVVDVRTPEEFAEGHLPGALNIPHEDVASRASELGPRDAPVVLYCRSGRRSALAAEALRGLGFTRVYDAQRYDALAQAAP